MSFDAAQAHKLLEKKLDALSGKTVLPPAMLTLVADTMRAQQRARTEQSVEIAPEMLQDIERVLRGAPLLTRESFPLDTAGAAALFAEISGIVRHSEPHLIEALDLIDAALADGSLDLDAAFARHVAGDDTFFAAFGEKTPNAPRLLNFLVQASLAPRLAAVGEAVYAYFPKERAWAFGQCPVCASPPLMGRLMDKAGARHLTCSFCQTEYRAKRLMCPYCGEEDTKKLAVFSAAEEPGYFVHVCHTCQCYIKTADFREFDRVSVPVLDDLESLTLDMAARGQGYNRPVLSAWGF